MNDRNIQLEYEVYVLHALPKVEEQPYCISNINNKKWKIAELTNWQIELCYQ